MSDSNKRKDQLLGEPHGTANSRLKKMIIFELVLRCGLPCCFRCGLEIESVDSLSIEHKQP